MNKIHIKKENRGKFGASAKRAGMGTQEYARHILANKDDYSSIQVKRAAFAKGIGGSQIKKHKHENGGILKAQEGTENNFWSKLWNAVKAGGMMARDAKLGAVGAQQVRDLYSEGKNQEAQDLAKQYAKANTTGIALAGGVASTGLLGDLMITGATTAADTFIDGDTENFGKNLALNTAFDLAGHGAGKLLKNVDWGKVRNGVELIPNTKANVSEYINTIDDALPERQPLTIRKSSQFWDGTSKSKLSVDEKMGLPKSERNQPIKSNPNAGAVTNVDTYLINRAYAPWEIRDGKFIFKMGEPINVRGLSERAPITFHFTTDTQVKPHSGGDGWANAKTTYLVPYKSVVKHNGMPANIEPMDTWWTAGSTFEFPTQDVKVLTADPKVYRQYKARGIDVEFSPEGRKLVRERKGMSDIVEQWIRNKQDQFGMRPTVDTYRQMERETGLPSNVRPKKKHLFGDYFEETNIPDYHTGPATHSNSWSFPAMANIGLPDDPKYFMSSIARNVALDLSKYKTFTFKDLPALQKLAQTHKQFDIQLPTTYGVKNEYSWDFSGQEELVDKINKILRGEIVVPYEQGGKL